MLNKIKGSVFEIIIKKGTLDSQPQNDKVYQLLAHGWWFSPGTSASSTTKTGRHNIAEYYIQHVK
jgi:hypothetical protein